MASHIEPVVEAFRTLRKAHEREQQVDAHRLTPAPTRPVEFPDHPYVARVEHDKGQVRVVMKGPFTIKHLDFSAHLHGEAEAIEGADANAEVVRVLRGEATETSLSQVKLIEDEDTDNHVELRNAGGKTIKFIRRGGKLVIAPNRMGNVALVPSNEVALRNMLRRHENAQMNSRRGEY